MRLIGFSTGSLALGNVTKALEMLQGTGVQAVELSALRSQELPVLVGLADSLPLDGYLHVSVHAPSRFSPDEEGSIVRLLWELAGRGWPIVAHPDAIYSYPLWREFGAGLWVENMDKRKPIGRSATELQEIFEFLPEAGLCLDLAHARQYDPSMVEAYRILRAHGSRVRQVHLSEVSSQSKHTRLSYGAIRDFAEVAHMVPSQAPAILESPVEPAEFLTEIARAAEALADPAPVLA